MAEKKSFGAYLEEAQKETRTAKVVLTEGAKELASKAQEYLKKKEKEEKSFDTHIKSLKSLAAEEFHTLTADDLILPTIVADEYHDKISDELAEEAQNSFDKLIDAMSAIQKVADKMAHELEKHKAEKELNKTIPK